MSDEMPHSVPAAETCPVCQAARGHVTVISASVRAGDEVADTLEALSTAARWVVAAHEWHEAGAVDDPATRWVRDRLNQESER